MNESLDFQEERGLPTFLKVLCILTFIGAGIGFISAFSGIFTAEMSMNSMRNSSEQLKNTPFGDMGSQIEAIQKWGFISNILNTIGNGLCLTGAILMWRLKKIGFFLYLGGHAISITASFLIMGSSTSSGGGNNFFSTIMMASMFISFIFVAAFIIMYAVNYKHLKN